MATDAPDSVRPEGADLIRDFVTRLPGRPGVYRMYDTKGAVLYVGKARNLKLRVSNYARGQGHNNRIALGVNDTMRAETLAAGIVGKRLTYRRSNEA